MTQRNKTEIVITALNQTQGAFREIKGQVNGLTKDIERVKKVAGGVPAILGALGVTLSAGAFLAWGKGAINAADDLSKLSQKIGVSVEDLSKLEYAASLSAVSNEQLGIGIKQLSKNMLDAAAGSKEQEAAFAALDVQTRNADGSMRSTIDVFRDVSTRMSEMEDGSTKTAISMKLFGKSGADLIPLLNEGAAGLSLAGDEAERLGKVISTQTALAAEEFNDNLTRLTGKAEGLGYAILNPLLPALSDLSTELVKISQSADSAWIKINKFLKIGLSSSPAGMLVNFKGSALGLMLGYGEKETGSADDLAKAMSGAGAGAAGAGSLDKGGKSPAELAVERFLKKYGESGAKSKALAAANKRAAEAKKAAADLAKALIDIDDTIAKNTLDKFDLEYREMNKQIAEYRKLGVDEVNIEKYKATETLRIQKELAEEVGKYRTDQIKSYTTKMAEMLQNEQQLKEAEIQLNLSLVDTAEAYHQISTAEAADKRLSLNKELLTVQQQWLGTMDKATDASGWLAQSQAIEETRQRILDLSKTVQAKSQDMAGGFSEGLRNYKETIPSLFESSRDAAQGFFNDMEDGFTDLFDNVLRGKIENFRDFFQQVTDSILSMLAQIMAKMTMASLTGSPGGWGDLASGVLGLFGSSSSAGPATSSWAAGAASSGRYTLLGSYAIGTDFVPATGPYLLHRGEGVKTVEEMARERMGYTAGNSYAVSVPITIENGNKAMIADLRREFEETAIRVLRRHS